MSAADGFRAYALRVHEENGGNLFKTGRRLREEGHRMPNGGAVTAAALERFLDPEMVRAAEKIKAAFDAEEVVGPLDEVNPGAEAPGLTSSPAPPEDDSPGVEVPVDSIIHPGTDTDGDCLRCGVLLDVDGRCAYCPPNVGALNGAGGGFPRAANAAPERVTLDTPDDISRPQPVDVTDRAVRPTSAGRFVVEGLWGEGHVIGIAGEEGEGKSLMADQILRQVLRGEPVLGFFELGELRPRRGLLVDTEMDDTENDVRARDAEARGLTVDPGTLFSVAVEGLRLDVSSDDQRWLAETVAGLGAEILWLDTGTNAVEDPKDDVAVRPFFDYLNRLKREAGVLAVGLTLQNRKREQGNYGRRFDDLFGSREWKGRLWKALYIEGSRIICWKDRGGHLRRLWPARQADKYPVATLERPGLGDDAAAPFVISAAEPKPDVDEATLREKAIALVTAKPDHYTRTSLADALGGKTQTTRAIVRRLVEDGHLGPNEDRAKLRVTGSE